MRALPLSRLIVILFPDVAGTLVLIVHVFNKIQSQLFIQLPRLRLQRPRRIFVVEQRRHSQVVDRHPDCSAPIRPIARGIPYFVEAAGLAQRSETIRRPQFLFVAEQLQHGPQPRRVRRKDLQQQRKQTHVALLSNERKRNVFSSYEHVPSQQASLAVPEWVQRLGEVGGAGVLARLQCFAGDSDVLCAGVVFFRAAEDVAGFDGASLRMHAFVAIRAAFLVPVEAVERGGELLRQGFVSLRILVPWRHSPG
mmetsp:Transcript_24364/g.43220  ORF Transcript_24364/g.43220 Transcript_24364/m.43220 type:complete len:252 (+) Transcript_24364:191-946(+)